MEIETASPPAVDASVPELAIGGRELRYRLSLVLLDTGRTLTVADLIASLREQDIVVAGRQSKVVSDALRWEIEHRRVVRLGRGRYRSGRIPTSTRWWLRRQVEDMRRRRAQIDPGAWSGP